MTWELFSVLTLGRLFFLLSTLCPQNRSPTTHTDILSPSLPLSHTLVSCSLQESCGLAASNWPTTSSTNWAASRSRWCDRVIGWVTLLHHLTHSLTHCSSAVSWFLFLFCGVFLNVLKSNYFYFATHSSSDLPLLFCIFNAAVNLSFCFEICHHMTLQNVLVER